MNRIRDRLRENDGGLGEPPQKMDRELEDIGDTLSLEKQVDDLWSTPNQEFTSADTSINIKKYPAAITKLKREEVFKKGDRVVDIGGGKHSNVESDFQKEGIDYLVYDPFNRTLSHNKEVINKIRDGQADYAVNNNVLNTIKEKDNQLRVITQAHNAIKEGKQAFFSVYKGAGDGIGKVTSKGYQRNENIKEYLPLIESVFGKDNVTLKNSVIRATKKAGYATGGKVLRSLQRTRR